MNTKQESRVFGKCLNKMLRASDTTCMQLKNKIKIKIKEKWKKKRRKVFYSMLQIDDFIRKVQLKFHFI